VLVSIVFVKRQRSKLCVATWSPLWNPMTEAMEELRQERRISSF
jgi:hypothetical protein